MKKMAGFTLIELMITVAIVGVIVAIAIPSYSNYVMKARRADGISMLLRVAAQQERYSYDENTFAANLSTLGYSANTVSSAENYYNISVAAVPAANSTSYTLLAVPTGAQADDTECGTLSIDAQGTKAKTGTGSVSDCW
ncbi:MAG: type IV pilin protein [Methylococcales bacterium]